MAGSGSEDGAYPARGVRVAVVATPRSGNTWLRRMLAGALSAPDFAVHELTPDVLSSLPADCVLQVHEPYSADLHDLLMSEGFEVVTIARHPLDVLVSILHFANYEPETARWLGGAGGDEREIILCRPSDRQFLDYALGPRAMALLEVTASWWSQAGVHRIRYEDLVEECAGTLRGVLAALGSQTRDLEHVVDDLRFDRLRGSTGNRHFWQGAPGTWSRVIPGAVAQGLLVRHASLLDLYGYDLAEQSDLPEEAADRNWLELARAAWLSSVRGTNPASDADRIRELESQCTALRSQLESAAADLAICRADRDAAEELRDRVLESRSWAVTRPLRSLGSRMGGRFRR